MDMESSIGPMVPTTKASGTSTKQKDKVLLYGQTEICTLVNGRMTECMAADRSHVL